MKRSEVYDALREILINNNLINGYILQARQWRDSEKHQRFIVIMPAGGGNTEQGFFRDTFRIIVVSAVNDSNIADVENHADSIRQTFINNYSINKIINIQPFGGVAQFHSQDGRFIYEININLTISR